MRDKTLVAATLLIAVSMLSIFTAATSAFVYPDGSQDNSFEIFGPRIDKILVKMYGSLDAEMLALQNGEIDITDSPLTMPWINTFASDPNIRTMGYGGEAGYYTMNFNHNNNPYLGNPEDPMYPNPVYPNPCSVMSLRQAFSYFVDRVALCAGPGEGLYDPIFTPIPAYMAYWIHPEIRYGGTLDALTYNPNTAVPDPITVAADLLTAGGFKMGGPGGRRYWDKNSNDVYDAGEEFNLLIYTRADNLRKGAGNFLCAGLDNPLIQMPYTRFEVTGGQAWQTVMVEKNYNIYTSGWTFIGPDPDYLYELYNPSNYYHPGWPNNFGAIGMYDELLNTYSEGIKFASDISMALTDCLIFQEQFAATACEIPLGSTAGAKAYNKWYTGGTDGALVGDGEDQYRGDSWTDLVNEKGQGIDSSWSMLNMYPVDHPYGDSTFMTVRYGWSQIDQPRIINPLYSSSYWENVILGQVYDSMGTRDPMTLGPIDVPRLAWNWTQGTWVDPRDDLTKTKVAFELIPNINWSDGQPLTVDDVIYTLCELPTELRAKGCPDVWWQSTIDQIVGFYKDDEYSGTILMNSNAVWATNLLIGNIILPKHFWQPFIASHTVAEISGDLGPAENIGTGPFLYESLSPGSTVTMVRNPYYYYSDQVEAIEFGSVTAGIRFDAIYPAQKIGPTTIRCGSGQLTAGVKVLLTITNINRFQSWSGYFKSYIYPLKLGGVGWSLVSEQPVTLGYSVVTRSKSWFVTQNLNRGRYRITAAWRVPSLTAWSTCFRDLTITYLGDLNRDISVDIFDIVIVASCFGRMIGDPGFNSLADVNRDARVDIFDIVLVAVDFGGD